MSRLFGDMRQVGIVVRDIEAAMRHWVEVCGVGPWFYTDRLPVTGFTYAGRRYDDVHICVALVQLGESHSMVFGTVSRGYVNPSGAVSISLW